MPVDWRRYPANWKEIRGRIMSRAKNRCEWCDAPDRAMIVRGAGADFRVVKGQDLDDAVEAGQKVVAVVLTTAHLGTAHPDGRPGDKHDKMDCRDENLAALCQRCHLKFDIWDHVANARRTRNLRKGQGDLFDGPVGVPAGQV
jgi:hypothetical protein